MVYEEFAVHPCLRPFIRCCWTLSIPPSVGKQKQHYFLSEGMEWIFNLADPLELLMDGLACNDVENSFFTGPMTRPMVVRPIGKVSLFGVCFKPGGAHAFIPCMVGEMMNQCISAADLQDAETFGIDDSILIECPGPQARVMNAERLFLQRLDGIRTMDTRTAFAVDTIERRRGRVDMDQLSVSVGLSHRQLERLFKAQVGLSPKQLCRSLRFKSVFHQLATSPGDGWAITSQHCGYYDQSHLIRDFKHYTGNSPAAFFKSAGKAERFFIGNFR